MINGRMRQIYLKFTDSFLCRYNMQHISMNDTVFREIDVRLQK